MKIPFQKKQMSDKKVKEVVKDAEEQREWLSDLVKLIVLVWSASLLTFSYVRLPNGQKILDFDPTFIASVFSGSLAGFGIAAAKNGNLNGQKKKDENPPVKSAVEPKPTGDK